MKTMSGMSLNNKILKGLTGQPALFNMLCRFQFLFKYVVVADIKNL